MFSRPVSSGWKPVPTSSSEPTRPSSVTCPSVGSVMRLRIFSSVLLPAPLRPMMPTTSPRLTSKQTSLRAQKELAWSIRPPPENARSGRVARFVRVSRKVR